MRYFHMMFICLLLIGCSSILGSPQKATDILQTVSTPIQVIASFPPKWTATLGASTPNTPLSDTPSTPADGQRYFETIGGYSFVPPYGWEIVEFPGLKYKIARGSQENNFSPNINFVDENYAGLLSAYTSASLDYLKKNYPQISCGAPGEFIADSGTIGKKFTCQNVQNGKNLAQTAYIFDAHNRMIVATYTRMANGGQTNDTLVDQSMRSFRLE
jgi:hypothetical protein